MRKNLFWAFFLWCALSDAHVIRANTVNEICIKGVSALAQTHIALTFDASLIDRVHVLGKILRKMHESWKTNDPLPGSYLALAEVADPQTKAVIYNRYLKLLEEKKLSTFDRIQLGTSMMDAGYSQEGRFIAAAAIEALSERELQINAYSFNSDIQSKLVGSRRFDLLAQIDHQIRKHFYRDPSLGRSSHEEIYSNLTFQPLQNVFEHDERYPAQAPLMDDFVKAKLAELDRWVPDVLKKADAGRETMVSQLAWILSKSGRPNVVATLWHIASLMPDGIEKMTALAYVRARMEKKWNDGDRQKWVSEYTASMESRRVSYTHDLAEFAERDNQTLGPDDHFGNSAFYWQSQFAIAEVLLKPESVELKRQGAEKIFAYAKRESRI
jgi:hypothetical protein